MDQNKLMRGIPKVDVILHQAVLRELGYREELIKQAVTDELTCIRENLLAGRLERSPDAAQVAGAVAQALRFLVEQGLRPLINAAGVIVYTNLGRAPLAPAALEAVQQAAGYSDLEYNLRKGERGSRQDHIRGLTKACFGAEDALVVNNNAAAVLLILAALSSGKEAVVSRGELVEIGGSFRMPDVMTFSGAVMREVGTTNKTRLSDYEKAIGPETALICKVHRSNFSVVGFTEETGVRELAELAHAQGAPLYVDMGSGVPFDLGAYGIREEWTIPGLLQQGADIISFSGDKVLGGPQAGIILGRHDLIATLAKHPLHRALRIDKLGIAALAATLRLFCREDYDQIPVMRMLREPAAQLRVRANRFRKMLECPAEVIATEAVLGGGAAPNKGIPSFGVRVRTERSEAWHAALRQAGVICRIEEDRLIFDLRCVAPEQLKGLAARVNEVMRRGV